MMRTIIELSDAQIKALDHLSRAQDRSRAAVIRDAVDGYVADKQKDQIARGFGLWHDRVEDGLTFQERMRSEW